ncbi:hypothetical protein [Streptomyces sp. NPDC047042]|uniref:SCO2400 family protein n=1 Tax=Streptomyces sp. NPDC047042 TaxID=3154807 RepID=UPI0033D7EB1A
MDYCHQCQRHLNGALACPGCGSSIAPLHTCTEETEAHPDPESETPAGAADEAAGPVRATAAAEAANPDEQEPGDDYEAVRPGRAATRKAGRGRGREAAAAERGAGDEYEATAEYGAVATAGYEARAGDGYEATAGYAYGPGDGYEAAAEYEAKPAGGYKDAPESEEAHRSEGAPEVEGLLDSEVEGDAGRGNGSRRDRKAAAHRRRRKRALLVVAGFVLAAGGLSLAELGKDAPGSNPEAAVADGAKPDGAATTKSGDETAEPLSDESPSKDDDPSDPASPDASSSPSPSASESSGSPSPSDSPSRSTSAQSGAVGTAPMPTRGNPSPTPTDATTPSPDPTATDPTPQPSPSETCKQFLWWCT